MAVKFNPFTGQLQIDEKGSGGGSSYIDGEVQNFSALPQTVGSPAVDSAYLVREAEGAWLLNRKPAGIYIRTANTGTRASDWTYAGEFPDVFNDANLVIYNDTDSTKNVKFDASSIATGTTRTITVPDNDVTLPDQGTSTTDSPTFSGLTLSSADGLNVNVLKFEDDPRVSTEERTLYGGPWSIEQGALQFTGADAATNAATTLTNIGAAAASHTHAASAITSGTLAHERGGLEADVSAYSGLVKISGGATSAVTVTATGESVIGAADAAAARSAISAAAASHTHGTGDITGLAASATTDTTNASNISTGTLAPARMGSGTPSASNYLRGDGSWQTVAAGGVTSGSVDNAILRADGTGGSTSQSSDINIDDATTTTQNNVAITNQHSGQTNSALVLTPKGTGAFIVGAKPDGVAAVGGNARGARAINISLARTAATQVASGQDSIAIGSNSTSSGVNTIAIGTSANNTSNSGAIAIGPSSSTNQNTTIVIGSNAQANNGADSVAMCRDANAGAQESIVIGPFSATTGAMSVVLGKSLSASLRAQFATLPFSAVYWGGQTTSDTANVELNLDATATNRMTIAANTAVLADIYVVARQTDNTRFLAARRWVAIRRDGSNNTALIGAVQTIGTDQSEGSPTWTFTIDADDTASVESLRVRVTGAASQTVNWRVMALYRVVA